jgi:hypothetical protein
MPSTAIRSSSYDPAKRELWVTFVTGRRYVYAEVPADVFEAFDNAPSRGAFFNEEIRDCYNFARHHPKSGADRQ